MDRKANLSGVEPPAPVLLATAVESRYRFREKKDGFAAAEFRKLLDHRGLVLNFVTGALAHLQLGRAYAMAGDTANRVWAHLPADHQTKGKRPKALRRVEPASVSLWNLLQWPTEGGEVMCAHRLYTGSVAVERGLGIRTSSTGRFRRGVEPQAQMERMA